jgi:hypothetical protein
MVIIPSRLLRQRNSWQMPDARYVSLGARSFARQVGEEGCETSIPRSTTEYALSWKEYRFEHSEYSGYHPSWTWYNFRSEETVKHTEHPSIFGSLH